MRRPLGQARLERLLEELGRRARGPGRIYLTGGATALLFGWRRSTVDVDLKLDPKPAGIFEAIAQLKEELQMNVELASPDQFIPPVPGWRERSIHIGRWGEVDFYHFDLVSQSLAKLARGQDRDVDDVRAMIDRNLVVAEQLAEGIEQIEGDLLRYPGVDSVAFVQRVRSFVENCRA
jgi:hypothetical protein